LSPFGIIRVQATRRRDRCGESQHDSLKAAVVAELLGTVRAVDPLLLSTIMMNRWWT